MNKAATIVIFTFCFLIFLFFKHLMYVAFVLTRTEYRNQNIITGPGLGNLYSSTRYSSTLVVVLVRSYCILWYDEYMYTLLNLYLVRYSTVPVPYLYGSTLLRLLTTGKILGTCNSRYCTVGLVPGVVKVQGSSCTSTGTALSRDSSTTSTVVLEYLYSTYQSKKTVTCHKPHCKEKRALGRTLRRTNVSRELQVK
jgi:hypothetical protein